jgi:hypothetical protein
MNFEQAIVQIQDTLIVMAEIQSRQAEVQKIQAHWLDDLRESYAVHEKRMNHIDLRLAEITDKLDGLIGFMGGFFDRPK